jgi:hypothetical protein
VVSLPGLRHLQDGGPRASTLWSECRVRKLITPSSVLYQGPPGASASVPFMMTQETKRRLRICGYSDAQIAGMTPQAAHNILGQWAPQPTNGGEPGLSSRRIQALADWYATSRFYEALRYELKQSSIHDAKRAALMAASDRCERIAAASINPSAMLDELRNAIAVLQADAHATVPPPPRARPVLRVIDGGLSKV